MMGAACHPPPSVPPSLRRCYATPAATTRLPALTTGVGVLAGVFHLSITMVCFVLLGGVFANFFLIGGGSMQYLLAMVENVCGTYSQASK